MDHQKFSDPQELVRYSFLWSQARLFIAAAALLMGGIPPIWFIVPPIPAVFRLVGTGLTLCWIVSGLAAAYLFYRWHTSKHMLFGKKDQLDMYAFLVSVVSGVNLGLTGLLGRNPGMSVLASRPVFMLVAAVYLGAAYHLYNRWNDSKGKMF